MNDTLKFWNREIWENSTANTPVLKLCWVPDMVGKMRHFCLEITGLPEKVPTSSSHPNRSKPEVAPRSLSSARLKLVQLHIQKRPITESVGIRNLAEISRVFFFNLNHQKPVHVSDDEFQWRSTWQGETVLNKGQEQPLSNKIENKMQHRSAGGIS